MFHLFAGDRDLENTANYQMVYGELRLVGRLAQVYVDRDDRDHIGINDTVVEALRLFDQEIGPWAAEHLGHVQDVDRDGRFTILLTGKLNNLQNGKVQVDGFVRGSDFFRDLPAPFSNHCDMLYLNARLKPGPHLRTVMAHEYTHAVTFCEHALTAYQEQPTNQDEESWLGEGLSHLVEKTRAFGWTNLDFRISAYLACPERYALVVPDYFGAGVWRTPGTRGAAFLFLRSCQTHADDGLVTRLIQSPLRGTANLEAATRQPFAELFRQAALDCLENKNYGYLDEVRHGPLLCGPRFQSVPLDAGHAEKAVTGTASAFFLLHSPSAAHVRLLVDADGPIQVTVVRLEPDAPRLSLRWVRAPGGLRLEVTAHHGAVWLRGAGCEELTTKGYQPPRAAPGFEQEWVEDGASAVTGPLGLLPNQATSENLFKVWGEDVRGRPVAAWITTKE
jgi:hypothetical protein